jgi:hypothetical protein
MSLHPQIIHNLRITAWNANSVTNKKAELDMFLRINKIDIAAISETKLSPNRRYSIPGYSTVRTDRIQFGGGIMLLINNKLRHDQYRLPSLTGLEATAIYLYLQNSRRLLFVSAYLQPTSILTHTDLDAIFTLHDSVILTGDLNSKHVAWLNPTVNKNGRTLLSYCTNKDIILNHPDQPTHFPPNAPSSVLDITLSKRCQISKPQAIPLLSSDPNPILFTIPLQPRITKPRKVYNYKHANWPLFRSTLDLSIPTHPPKLSTTDLESHSKHQLNRLQILPSPSNQ